MSEKKSNNKLDLIMSQIYPLASARVLKILLENHITTYDEYYQLMHESQNQEMLELFNTCVTNHNELLASHGNIL